jgi:hypothetical protein
MDQEVDFESIRVTNNINDSRFEAEIGDHLAIISYALSGERIAFIHTAVPQEISGHGVASKMAKFALDFAREEGLRVVPICPFVAGYIKRHSEYQDLVGR